MSRAGEPLRLKLFTFWFASCVEHRSCWWTRKFAAAVGGEEDDEDGDGDGDGDGFGGGTLTAMDSTKFFIWWAMAFTLWWTALRTTVLLTRPGRIRENKIRVIVFICDFHEKLKNLLKYHQISVNFHPAIRDERKASWVISIANFVTANEITFKSNEILQQMRCEINLRVKLISLNDAHVGLGLFFTLLSFFGPKKYVNGERTYAFDFYSFGLLFLWKKLKYICVFILILYWLIKSQERRGNGPKLAFKILYLLNSYK